MQENFDTQTCFPYNEYMDFKRLPYKTVFIFLIELAIAANIIFLDIWIAQKILSQQPSATSTSTTTKTTEQEPGIINPLPTNTPTPVAVIPTTSPQVIIAPAVTDYYVPIGSGQSVATSWTDVTGLQVSINPSSYPNSKQVVFEASVVIPTGNQWASVRLFNETAQHPVWFSDVTLSGGQPQLLVSQPITLDPGNNTYQVQMQTQLGFQAILNQSRIHITLRRDKN